MTLKKITLLGFTALQLCSGDALLADNTGAILKPDALRKYVTAFNSQRPDDTAEGLPGDGSVTVISNAQASAWMERNVPLFECSDKDIEEAYYFRWWTYRKHIWKTPDGFVVTEFLPKVSWSKKYNTINCPVGHQLYEGRWLRDPKIINDYAQFHFGKGGDPGGSSKMYSQWITDGIYAHYLVNADKLFVTGLLDALVKNHEAWKQGNPALHPWQRSRLLDNGLYWQVDSWEGQEFSIGGTGIRPPMNAYMFGEAVAIAKIAELAGKKELADQYRAEAEQVRKQVQDHLWDSDAKFFKVMRHEMAPMNQYSNSVAEACEPGQLVKVREIFGLVPWYFNLPESGRGYEEAWRQLIDPQGFFGLYGPTVAERRHPKFFINAAGCMWCGASWPFSTAQTLTALANVLNNYNQDVVGKKEYFDTLKAYTRSHRLTLDDGRVVSWLDESLNPDTGRWMKVGPFPKTRGRDYNHSTYCDLVITGLVGLRPRADDLVEVNPLVPEGVLEYFCLDNVRYHGRNLTIMWDKTGNQYGRGVGLRVLADGQEIAHSETLTRVTGNLLHPLDKFNVVWTSPSKDYNGSMPIGNGELAANVWVEPTGDLIFYLSKSDTWTGGGPDPELVKLGRIRVRLDKPLVQEGSKFRQELDLKTGSITVHSSRGDQNRDIRFWIDANRPVVHVDIQSSVACTAEIALESWRAEGKWLQGGAQKDVILASDGQTVRWYQRNVHSIFGDSFKGQHLGDIADQFQDPLMNRTFGGLMAGEGLKAKDKQTLVTSAPAEKIHVSIHALTAQTKTPEAWLAQLEQQRQVGDAVPSEQAWPAHVQWWQAFWNRSTIDVSGTPDAEAACLAYQRQRWVQACAGRGNYPIKFNGSLFTVDGMDVYWKFPEGQYCGPDYRRWGGPYWFQNTRLIYWPMLASGDFDQMAPLFTLYRNMLPLLKERTRRYSGHAGVFFSETAQIWGLNRACDYGKDNPDFYSKCPYTKYYWDGGLELSTMLLAYYQHTEDDSFVKETLLPIADQVVLFYDQHYKRTPDGKLHISPSQALETWHTAEDPLPVVAGLRTVLAGLIVLPEPLTTVEQRTRWQRLLGEVKELPVAEDAGKKWLKPAHIFSDKRNAENPELYAVFPYPIYGVGKPDLEIGRETFARRANKRTGGWQQDAIQAALLGLTDQAKTYLLQNVTTENLMGGAVEKAKRPDSRFPAFWGPNFDWIPDQCNGSVILTTLQYMLMQTDGKAIHLLPAWPKDWNATFKLHAPYQTIVEGRVVNGEVIDLKVTPESRRKDIHPIPTIL